MSTLRLQLHGRAAGAPDDEIHAEHDEDDRERRHESDQGASASSATFDASCLAVILNAAAFIAR